MHRFLRRLAIIEAHSSVPESVLLSTSIVVWWVCALTHFVLDMFVCQVFKNKINFFLHTIAMSTCSGVSFDLIWWRGRFRYLGEHVGWQRVAKGATTKSRIANLTSQFAMWRTKACTCFVVMNFWVKLLSCNICVDGKQKTWLTHCREVLLKIPSHGFDSLSCLQFNLNSSWRSGHIVPTALRFRLHFHSGNIFMYVIFFCQRINVGCLHLQFDLKAMQHLPTN